MESIGRYTVLRQIGSGGMAEVFLARARGAEGTEKLLVIKKIHPALARNERFIEMFVDEARVAMRLNHSNIVQVYAFERTNFGIIHLRTDGERVLVFTHSGKRGMNEAYRFTVKMENGERVVEFADEVVTR